jgi:hypothetical protein
MKPSHVDCLMPRRPRQVYRFGKFEFTAQGKARRFFGSIRNPLIPGEEITDADHVLAVAELFRGHIEYEEKSGCGVKRFFVDFAPNHPNSTCFWIERSDGTKTDFGFPACVQTIGGLNRQSFRALIRPQIYAFKDRRLAECGDWFESDYSGESHHISDAHIDHEIEFEEIVRRFADQEGIDIDAELLTVACDARSEPTWKDANLAERFKAFHRSFPLRLVSKNENLSELRRKKVMT